jgi:hypothetical protein
LFQAAGEEAIQAHTAAACRLRASRPLEEEAWRMRWLLRCRRGRRKLVVVVSLSFSFLSLFLFCWFDVLSVVD